MNYYFWEFSLDSVKGVPLVHNIFVYKALNIITFTLHRFSSCLSSDHVLFTFKAVFIPSHAYLFKSLLHIWYITFLRFFVHGSMCQMFQGTFPLSLLMYSMHSFQQTADVWEYMLYARIIKRIFLLTDSEKHLSIWCSNYEMKAINVLRISHQ